MAYDRNQKHRNQSDTSTRNHDSNRPSKPHFKRKKRLTREDFQVPGNATAVRVPDGDIGQALKRFKKMMKQTEIIEEYKERRRYEKPSKVKYEALKKVKTMTSRNDKRAIERERKQVWLAIVNGQAQ
jgi:ribosomal protein S21